MPSADRADDEDLACNHADHPTEAPSSMHCESSLWNEAFMDVLISSSLSNPFANAHGSLGMDSDGENDCPIDIQLDDYHQDILVEEIEDDDDDLPSSDSVVREFDSGGHSFLPGLSFNQHVSASDPFRDMDFTGLTPVLDLDDSDDDTSFNSSQATSHHGNNGFDDLAFGSTFRLINPRGGHIAHVEASEDGNSQDEVSQILGKEGGSQATPTELLISSILPSISGSLSNRVKDSMEQLQTIDYWPQQPTEVTTSREDDADIFAAKDLTRQEAFASDHDLELGFLSDSGCNDSNPMELSFEPNGRFFENSGDSAGVVARHGFLGTAFSHQRTNLNVTWPSQSECEHQLRHSLDAIEDSDEEFWNAEIGGDLGVGEDDMFAKLNPQEQQLFAKYGKLPTHKNILMKMQKDRKYFDSGDYALSKAGVAPQNTVGTAIPNPENIPHASPGNGHSNNGHQGLSVSPTNSTSPVNKESGLAHDQNDDSLSDEPQGLTATPEPIKD
ncbi:hypothetical protein DXG01_008729 [Tephrocybe rancida]|nr:hypothetical protein DXG01_008729 [Tephrocybe rancida]